MCKYPKIQFYKTFKKYFFKSPSTEEISLVLSILALGQTQDVNGRFKISKILKSGAKRFQIN